MTKISRKNFKPAFTLAEVLITLVIIGVIAAATIPTLMQKHFEQEMISKLKKTYSVLNNAYLQAIRENGSPDEWELGDSSTAQITKSENLYNYIKPYLKIQKECGTQTGCFGENYRTLAGDELSAAYADMNSYRYFYKFLLEDGTSIAIYRFPECTENNTRKKYYEKACGSVYLDLNNKKGPNKFGWDMFQLTITEKNLVPLGLSYIKLATNNSSGDNYSCNITKHDTYNGFSCGAHVITKGNMDYLHRDVESEWK